MSELTDRVKELRDAGATTKEIEGELVRDGLENYAKPENWPDRYLIHDSGMYQNQCCHCLTYYLGPKHTFCCWPCHSPGKDRMEGDNTRNEGFLKEAKTND